LVCWAPPAAPRNEFQNHAAQDGLFSGSCLRRCRATVLRGWHSGLAWGSSIGIAVYPEHGDDGKMLIRNADIAMYYARGNGRNNAKFHQPDMKEAARRANKKAARLAPCGLSSSRRT
jgi:hypothetical protein